MKVRNPIRKFWAFRAAGEGDDMSGGAGAETNIATGDVENLEGIETATGSVPTAGTVNSTDTSNDASPNWEELIPENLREKDYFQNVLKAENPGEELVKQFDNAQQLIGKKGTGVPSEDASDEEWEKFYDSVRPKETSVYEIPDIHVGDSAEEKQLAEQLNGMRTPEKMEAIKGIFQKAALTPKQAKILSEEYTKSEVADYVRMVTEAKETQTKLDNQFDDMAKEHFGGNSDEMLAVGKKFIGEMLSEDERALLKGASIEKLPNEALMLVARLAKGVYAKYEQGDAIKTTTKSGASTIADLDTEINDLMASEAYQNSFDKNHDSTVAKVKELIDQQNKLRLKS